MRASNTALKRPQSAVKARGDFVESLEKGFRVLRAFDATHATMTLSDVAVRAGLTRAAARRFLLTLVELGYATSDGKRFALTARVLELGFAYLSSAGLPELITPYLRKVSEALEESSSASVLDGEDIVYVARVATRRIMSIDLGVGARLPAAHTSMGRVLLAYLPAKERDARVDATELIAHTRRTITSRTKLRGILEEVHERRYCLVDQELEDGLRSIAVPILDRRGHVHAAMNVGAQANRVSVEMMKKKFLPVLKDAARELQALL